MSFPNNPAHGAVVTIGGVQYQYDGRTKSWNRVEGLLTVASIDAAGQMTPDEYKKLGRLLIPPPQSTIKAQGCSRPFTGGVIDLVGGDDYITIRGDIDLVTSDGVQTYENRIHENTMGFNFHLDINTLLEELIARGQVRFVVKTGDRGKTGAAGAAGADKLPVGPIGNDGKNGQSSSQLSISTEPLAFDQGTSASRRKVVTNIVPDESTGQFIVYRSLAGDPNAAPDRVNVGTGSSTWLLALPSAAPGAATPVYVDIEPILDALVDKYESELERLKSGYEEVTGFWLSKMSAIFDSQKQALCCALERCRSKNKAADTRRYLESTRIQALQAGVAAKFQFNRTTGLTKLAQVDACKVAASARSGAVATPRSVKDTIVRPQPGVLAVDALANSGRALAASIELLPGKYSVVISDCCAHSNGQFGVLPSVVYQSADGEVGLNFVQVGYFADHHEAREAFVGLSAEIEHVGGEVRGFFDGLALGQDAFGVVEVSFLPIVEARELKVRASDLDSIAKAWASPDAEGVVLDLDGQDYMIVRWMNSWVAWPTFDKLHPIDFGEKSYRLVLNDGALRGVLQVINARRTAMVKGKFKSLAALAEDLQSGVLFLEL